MKLNRKLMMVLALVLSVAMATSGTIAYLSDTDSDVNVMTLGKVDIEQIEQEWNGDKLQAFTQSKPLYPAVSKEATITGNKEKHPKIDAANVVDKYVSVKNTGKSDAYVRTVFAFEAGAYKTFDEFADVIGYTYNNDAWTWSKDPIPAVIDGHNYIVVEAVHKAIVKAGESTIPSLQQVYMDKSCDNEHVEAIDGNGNGTYDILVVSQGIQTAGFDSAAAALNEGFGVVAENPAAPFDGEIIPTENITNNAELDAALKKGTKTLYLADGTYQMPASAKGKSFSVYGSKNAVIEVVPAGQGEAGGQLDYSLDGSTVSFNGVTIKTNSKTYAGYARLNGTYNNCTLQNTYNLSVGNSEFNNCEFNITNEYLRVGGAYKATFNNCTFNTEGRAILVFQDGTKNAQTVTVKDCTFKATAPAQTWNGIHVAAVSIDGSQGGSYVVNLEGNNVVDSDFNGLWQIKAQKDPANVTVSANGNVETIATATTSDELNAALNAGATIVELGDGNIKIPASAKGKELTFIGNGETTIEIAKAAGEGADGVLDGSKVTFENLTINTDSQIYTGYARMNGTYKNCTINGTYTLYGDSEFIDCTFNVSGDVYNVWTWGAPTATFENCTFNSDGKAMLLYGTANTKLTLNNCEFNDKGGLTDLKAAIEIGNDYNKSYELIVNNTTVTGYEINDKGIGTGTTLWANKNSMSQDKLNVVVDGVDVY